VSLTQRQELAIRVSADLMLIGPDAVHTYANARPYIFDGFADCPTCVEPVPHTDGLCALCSTPVLNLRETRWKK
jgi:hypothetical protein